MTKCIAIKNLEFCRDGHLVLRIPELRICAGAIVAILGPTGCGKTTFLKLLCGLEVPEPDSTIDLFGYSPASFRLSGQMNFSFQAPVLLPWLPVVENVLLPLRVRGQEVKDLDRVAACKAISSVQLSEAQNLFPEKLSSGMASRAAVAQALTSRSCLLMMDEVFGTLDEVTRIDLDVTLRAKNDSEMHATILFVTHSIEEAVLLADRVIILDTPRCSDDGSSIVFDQQISLPARDRPVRDERPFGDYKRQIESSFPRHI